MKNSSSNSNVNFFNAHTDSLGYLNSITLVEPRARDNFDAFVSLSYCELEGNPDNPRKKYLSLTIANPAVESLLEPYWDDINDDEVKVFCKIRYSDAQAKPFIFSDKSAKAGQLGVNYSGKAISLSSMKIGDLVVELPGSESKTPVPAKRTSREASKATPRRESRAPSQDSIDDLPFAVKLSKNDRDFDRVKARLKRDGYYFHNELVLWCLPVVNLSENDRECDNKMDELTDLGYTQDRDDEYVWTLEFPKRQQSLSSSRPGQRRSA